MTNLYDKFEDWFKEKYPYPTSLMVTPSQKEHLRESFLAGAENSKNDTLNFLDQLLEGLTKGDK